jgi:hypothetical protein
LVRLEEQSSTTSETELVRHLRSKRRYNQFFEKKNGACKSAPILFLVKIDKTARKKWNKIVKFTGGWVFTNREIYDIIKVIWYVLQAMALFMLQKYVTIIRNGATEYVR